MNLKSKQTPQPKDTNLVVPPTKQPLYDPLSKILLKPGDKIRPVVVDDSWLVHKHREVVQDYSDLSSSEKEFIQEWDKFVISRRVSSDAYIPRTMLDFIEEKGLWLVVDHARTIEFGKHMAVMIARSLLSNGDIEEITKCLNFARKRAQEKPSLTAAAEASAVPKTRPHRSKSGCTVCGLPVLGPSMLICSNKVRLVHRYRLHNTERQVRLTIIHHLQGCSHRLYHSNCIAGEAIVSVKKPGWVCNGCARLA